MRYHTLVPLTAAVANLVLCIPVLRASFRNPILRGFALMTLTIAAWNLDIFALCYFTEAETAEWWSRIFRIGICFAPVAAFHAALILADSRGRVWNRLLVLGYAMSSFLAVANIHGDLVKKVT